MLHDEVSIKVALEVSNQTDQVKTSSGTLTYTIGTRNANTVLRLKNGETQVLAGLFRDDSQDATNKVPGLASLPIIGRLFSDKNSNHSKKEIVLLITPRILSNLTLPNAVYSWFLAGTDASANGVARPQESNPALAISNAPLVQTQQEVQAERTKQDKSFADFVTQPEAANSVAPLVNGSALNSQNTNSSDTNNTNTRP